MELRAALKEQYRGGLMMLRQCIEACPDDLWHSGRHPRTFWRIAYHALFYTHLYLGQNEAAFQPWERHRDCAGLWENPPVEEPFSQQDLLEYVDSLYSLVGPTVEGLDLETGDPGFSWYKNIDKLSHQMMNLRHLQGHVGQLSELLMAHGIDIDWVAKHPRHPV